MDYQVRAESGRQLLARLSSRPSLKGLDERLLGADGPFPHDVIEVTGEASVGKSTLVLQWIARAILSPPRGGLGVEVLLIDTDHHQPLFMLVQLLQGRMKAFMAQTDGLKLSSSLMESSIKDALTRLTVLNVYDSTNLHAALLAMETMLPSKPQISMVVLDSLSAFYWSDRLSGGLLHMDSYLKHILAALQKSTKEHKVTVVFTKPSYFQSAAPSRSKTKGNSGESTRLIKLNRIEIENTEEGSKDTLSNESKDQNIYCATVQSAFGLISHRYQLCKEGMEWL